MCIPHKQERIYWWITVLQLLFDGGMTVRPKAKTCVHDLPNGKHKCFKYFICINIQDFHIKCLACKSIWNCTFPGPKTAHKNKNVMSRICNTTVYFSITSTWYMTFLFHSWIESIYVVVCTKSAFISWYLQIFVHRSLIQNFNSHDTHFILDTQQ